MTVLDENENFFLSYFSFDGNGQSCALADLMAAVLLGTWYTSSRMYEV